MSTGARDPSTEDFRCLVVSQSRDEVVVHIAGELDRFSVDRLDEVLARAISGPWTSAQLDLSAVTFMDTASVTAIERHIWRARATGRNVTVVTPSGPAQRMIELTEAAWVLEELHDRRSQSGGERVDDHA